MAALWKASSFGLATNPIASSRRAAVVVRADGPRVTREYREDDASIVTPSSNKPQSNQPIYADEAMQQQAMRPKKQDNMSKEMKQRLRQEYMGLGGAENTAMSNNYFLWIIVVISALAVASKLSGAL